MSKLTSTQNKHRLSNVAIAPKLFSAVAILVIVAAAVAAVGVHSIHQMADGIDRMSVAESRSVLASRLGLSLSNYSRLVQLMPTMVTADMRSELSDELKQELAEIDERTEGLQALIATDDGKDSLAEVIRFRGELMGLADKAGEAMTKNDRTVAQVLVLRAVPLANSAQAKLRSIIASDDDLLKTEMADTKLAAQGARRFIVWFSLGGIAVGLSAVLALVLLTVTRPLGNLNRAMEKIVGGNLDQPVDSSGGDEIAAMARAVEVFRGNARALRKSEARYRDLLDNLIEGVYQAHPDGRLIGANRAMAELLGFDSPEQMIRDVRDIADAFYADFKDCAQVTERLTRDGLVRGFEAQARRKDGSMLFAASNVKAVYDEDGGLVRIEGTMNDITARKKAESEIVALNTQLEARVLERTAELEAARKEAEAANRVKSEFLASMSHELRTPLNAILGYSEMIRDELFGSAIDRRYVAYADHIYTAGEHLLMLINNILDLSKIESGKMEIDVAEFDLSRVVAGLVDDIIKTRRDSDVYINCNLLNDFNNKIVGDAFKLKQILYNIIGNAIKFTKHGSVDITVSVKDRNEDSVNVIFDIRDNGIGIAPENISHLFKSFSQVDVSTARRYGGTGLGLAITKQLVELMGGQIGAESQLGKGSRFWFVLPFRTIP